MRGVDPAATSEPAELVVPGRKAVTAKLMMTIDSLLFVQRRSDRPRQGSIDIVELLVKPRCP